MLVQGFRFLVPGMQMLVQGIQITVQGIRFSCTRIWFQNSVSAAIILAQGIVFLVQAFGFLHKELVSRFSNLGAISC